MPTLTTWTDHLIKIINEKFDHFAHDIKFYEDGSCSVEIEARGGSVYISTHSNEYTIGENDRIGNCINHYHLGSMFGYDFTEQAQNLENEIFAALKNPDQIECRSAERHDRTSEISPESIAAKRLQNNAEKINHFIKTGNSQAAEMLMNESAEIKKQLIREG